MSPDRVSLLCRDDNNNEFFIPIEYTSMKQTANNAHKVDHDCDFRFDDLLSLLELMGDIGVM